MDLVFLVGDFGVSSAYSGGVGTVVFVNWIYFCLTAVEFSRRRLRRFSFASAYSGFVGTMTIVGVSFRTGLRG